MTLARYLATAVALIAMAAVHRPAGASGPSNTIVRMETSAGDILLEMQPVDVAPITIANFLSYVDDGFYDGLIFHRAIDDFMIQGGGFDPNLVKRVANDTIENESRNGLLNVRGTIAMAFADPNDAKSEFFINQADNPHLDPTEVVLGHAVFGRVLEGIDIVDSIAATPTEERGSQLNVPIETVLIQRASRIPLLVDVTVVQFDPCSNAIVAFLDEDIVLSVRIENAGSQPFAPDAIDPCSRLTFSLVEAGMAADDPNAEVLGQLSPPALAAGAVANEILLITPPSPRGAYTLAISSNDSRMAGGFKLADDMRRQSLAMVVEPNQADLEIAAPADDQIFAKLDELLTVPVTVENTGRAAAESFAVALYISTDPNFADDPNAGADSAFPDHDPNAELAATFNLDSLAVGAEHEGDMTFSAPSERGTYFLVARADDGNDVLEFDESNNLGQTITLIVEPNAPDLIVLDPDQSAIATWTQAQLDFSVTVQNTGAVGAGTFTVQFYLATDPNFSANDPGTQRVAAANFVVDQLEERTSRSETVSVVMPTEPGTYYLRAVADDSNDVLEFDENNNAWPTVTLTVDNRIDITRLKAKAGIDPNTDGFDLRGHLTNVGLDDLLGAITIDLEIGTYSQSLDVEGLPGLVGAKKYVYRGDRGAVTLAIFDMHTGKFRIIAKDVSMRGTTDPVPVRITFADYVAVSEVPDALINRGKGIPFRYQMGLADALRVDKYRYTTFASTRSKDSIRVSGRISLENYPIDLSAVGVIANYSRSFRIDEGDDGLRQKGTSQKYQARRSRSDGAAITKAVFNLEKCTFSISILRKVLLNPPPRALILTLVQDGEVIFEEVAAVGK